MADQSDAPAEGTRTSKRKAVWRMDWSCKFSASNPKKENSQAFGRFAVYRTATTIQEAVKLGACMRDLDSDFKAGHLTCEEATASLAEGQAPSGMEHCDSKLKKTTSFLDRSGSSL